MSYQEAIRRILTDLARETGRKPDIDVTVARPGSFEMKILLRDGEARYERIFDLATGLTPRTSKSIRSWFEESLSPTPAARREETDDSEAPRVMRSGLQG
jgi:hypothetical protein